MTDTTAHPLPHTRTKLREVLGNAYPDPSGQVPGRWVDELEAKVTEVTRYTEPSLGLATTAELAEELGGRLASMVRYSGRAETGPAPTRTPMTTTPPPATATPTPAAVWGEGWAAHAAGKTPADNPYVPKPPKPTTERVASLNMRNTLTPFVITPAQAEAGLTKVLADTDLIALQEWAGTSRNAILRKLGPFTSYPQTRAWFPLTTDRKAVTGWVWARPATGGPTVGARADRYALRFVRSALLALPGRVDKVPGYRSLLGASRATVTGWTDLQAGGTVVLIDFHLTTHVEAGGHYRPECPLREARHRTEVAQLEKVARYHIGAGRRVYVVGDTNYHGLELAGLRSCWTGVPAKPLGGTLAGRRVDTIYTNAATPTGVRILESDSDHRHPIATFAKAPR